jgi:ABC-type uncharacterized transport system permease subunit
VIDEFGAKFFAMVLLVLTIFTGILFLLDLFIFRKQRRQTLPLPALMRVKPCRFVRGRAMTRWPRRASV